jgi:phosphatidate cytidylyltransferase
VALGTVLGALLVLTAFPGSRLSGESMAVAGAFCIAAVLTARLFSPQPVDGALDDVAVTVTGILYVGLLFAFQAGIHAGPAGRQWLLFLYFVIWASDTGAYYVGSAFGRHRLYEKISPKKSIEGLIGGTAASMLVAYACARWLVQGLGAGDALVLGAVLSLIGTVGDLAESLIKRSAGVKDSGVLIPGHGGILDRMDSMLFAAPALFYYIRMR